MQSKESVIEQTLFHKESILNFLHCYDIEVGQICSFQFHSLLLNSDSIIFVPDASEEELFLNVQSNGLNDEQMGPFRTWKNIIWVMLFSPVATARRETCKDNVRIQTFIGGRLCSAELPVKSAARNWKQYCRRTEWMQDCDFGFKLV